MPFVAEPGSKNKLSKRKIAQYLKNADFKKVYEHAKAIADRIGVAAAPESFNPVLIDFYKQVGYLPAALLNYLVTLGWALEDNREDFTLAQMTELFSLDRVVSNPASLDVKKLFAFQARYMQARPNAEKVELALPFLVRRPRDRRGRCPALRRARGGSGRAANDRCRRHPGVRLSVPAGRPHRFRQGAATKHLTAGFKGAAIVPPLADVLAKLRAVIAGAEPFTHDALKAATENLAQTEGAKPGPLSQVLRVATTGREVGFSAYDTFALLGRDRCLARIDRCAGDAIIATPQAAVRNRSPLQITTRRDCHGQADTDAKTPSDKPDAPSLNFIQEIIEEHNKNGRFGGRVHTRFPPEPNGYLHIGHAKSICLNYGLAVKYGGKFNLRYDDTNPTTEEQEYVDSIRDRRPLARGRLGRPRVLRLRLLRPALRVGREAHSRGQSLCR